MAQDRYGVQPQGTVVSRKTRCPHLSEALHRPMEHSEALE
jgi:hypothetical protein